MKQKIFISSVQTEFANERQILKDYLLSDPLLGRFFDVFLFENLPAIDVSAQKVYLKEVENCHIYLGLLGIEYGFGDRTKMSPTEREFDHATKHHKIRLVFLSDHRRDQRHKKENALIEKAQAVLIRKKFRNIEELKTNVYASLVRVLYDLGKIIDGPFDASINSLATINDISARKVSNFVVVAQSKRGFPISEKAPAEEVLQHLNLMNNVGKLTNAALLLFATNPQKFFINSEIRCVHYHGIEVSKPIPSYKVYYGDVFALVDQTVDFVLSKLDYTIGTRVHTTDIPGQYEIPRAIIVEAIVNAIAHRDYNSKGSVQVMLFKDRLEVHNPGGLPLGWTTDKLKHIHTSVPANPLLAQPMYLAGYIERLGTGIADMLRLAKISGLKEPDFVQNEDFTTIIHRVSDQDARLIQNKPPSATPQVPPKYPPSTPQVKNLLVAFNGVMSREEIQRKLKLKDRKNFRKEYIVGSLESGMIEMIYPKSPNHPKQKYRLTSKGKETQKRLLDKS